MSLILKNGTFIDYRTLEFRNSDIVVSDTSSELDFVTDFQAQPGDTIVDCSGKYIMHSFADAYVRPGLSLAAQAKVFTKKEATYFRYVSDILWNIDKCIDKDLLYASALYAAMRCVRTGTTFAICRNESSKFVEGSLPIINAAFNKFGVDTLQSFAASEADGYAMAERELNENLNYLQSNQGLMGIAASYLSSDELIRTVSGICAEKGVGVLINTAEDHIDQVNTMRDHRRSVILRLYESGIMDHKSTVLANCNAISDDERCYIKNKPSWIVQNPYGNFQRGIVPFNSVWLDNNVMLGSDFSGSGMLHCMRHAYFQSVKSDNEIEIKDSYARLNAVHNYLKANNFGGDGDNNLIVFENMSPFDLDGTNFMKHLLYTPDSVDIKLVISNGRIVAKNGHSTLVDEREVLHFINEQAKRIIC